MNRRGFFKTLIATTVGIFATKKSAALPEKEPKQNAISTYQNNYWIHCADNDNFYSFLLPERINHMAWDNTGTYWIYFKNSCTWKFLPDYPYPIYDNCDLVATSRNV
jgi:hypothetical protein